MTIEHASGNRRLPVRKGHPIARDLPAHWDGISISQSREERTAAILRNIATDNVFRDRGLDPVEARAGNYKKANLSGRQALARIARLGN